MYMPRTRYAILTLDKGSKQTPWTAFYYDVEYVCRPANSNKYLSGWSSHSLDVSLRVRFFSASLICQFLMSSCISLEHKYNDDDYYYCRRPVPSIPLPTTTLNVVTDQLPIFRRTTTPHLDALQLVRYATMNDVLERVIDLNGRFPWIVTSLDAFGITAYGCVQVHGFRATFEQHHRRVHCT